MIFHKSIMQNLKYIILFVSLVFLNAEDGHDHSDHGHNGDHVDESGIIRGTIVDMLTNLPKEFTSISIIKTHTNEDNLLQGSIEDIEVEKEYMVPQKYLSLSKFYKKIYPNIKDFISFKKERYADATWVSFRLTECLPLDSSTKNKLIALDNAFDRLDKLNEIVNKLYKKELGDL